MLNFNVDESIGYWVTITSHALRRAMESKLAGENITLRQWEVLAWIAIAGEQSQSELAERLGIEPPTLAGVLSRMERDGWLERRCCQEDRRKKLISATPQAETEWNRLFDRCQEVRKDALQGISVPELRFFQTICQRILHNLENLDREDNQHESQPEPIEPVRTVSRQQGENHA